MPKPKHRGKPWTQIIAEFEVPMEILHQIGKFLVQQVVLEAKKEHAKQRGRRPGEPMGLPGDKDFYESFSYRIKKNQVEVFTDWPDFGDLVEGKDPYKMRWLKSTPHHSLIVPMRDHNTHKLIFRMAPLQVGDYWVHPGVAKHTFLEKAKKRTAEEAKRLFLEYLGTLLFKGDPTR